MNKSKRRIILGVCLLVVAVLVLLIIFILKPWGIKEPKDWIEEVKWYSSNSYEIYEENGKDVIYNLNSGFKFFIPTDWNWNVGLSNYWAYAESPNTVFQDETSLATGCYVLVSAFIGEEIYSNVIEDIEQLRGSPKSAIEVIEIDGTEGLYTKYIEGFNFSIINIPFQEDAILRIKIFYPQDEGEKETCSNAFLEIINEAERVAV